MGVVSPKDLFEVLAREHSDMLMLYLRSCVYDVNLAEDLFQETMLIAWRKLDQFDKSRPFGPWLRGIAAKLVLAQRRKSARGLYWCDEKILEHLDYRCAALQKQASDTLEEKLAALRDCLEVLPEPYRQAVRLRYEQDLKGATLAERLQTSVENTKKRLQRGREKLLDCLKRKRVIEGAVP